MARQFQVAPYNIPRAAPPLISRREYAGADQQRRGEVEHATSKFVIISWRRGLRQIKERRPPARRPKKNGGLYSALFRTPLHSFDSYAQDGDPALRNRRLQTAALSMSSFDCAKRLKERRSPARRFRKKRRFANRRSCFFMSTAPMCEYTLNVGGRKKPMSVCPHSRAN